ncbi:MAG TPA: hypothetical protein DHW15_00485 [Bacteroidetes bacterium]|nr:hypothetical protein [Bacteroidota bacterium]
MVPSKALLLPAQVVLPLLPTGIITVHAAIAVAAGIALPEVLLPEVLVILPEAAQGAAAVVPEVHLLHAAPTGLADNWN